jgi:hypothetical protein
MNFHYSKTLKSIPNTIKINKDFANAEPDKNSDSLTAPKGAAAQL